MAFQNTPYGTLINTSSGFLWQSENSSIYPANTNSVYGEKSQPPAYEIFTQISTGLKKHYVFGGGLEYLSITINSVDPIDNTQTFITENAIIATIEDASQYGTFLNNMYYIVGGTTLSATNVDGIPTKVHYLGGRIMFVDGTDGVTVKNLPLNSSYTIDLDNGDTVWTTSGVIVDNLGTRIDMTYGSYARLNSGILAAGICDFENEEYTSLYRIDLVEGLPHANPTITKIDINPVTYPEAANILPYLKGGSGHCVYDAQAETNTCYFMTNGAYRDLADTTDYSHAVLKYVVETGVASVLFGTEKNYYDIPNKRFVMTGNRVVAGTGALAGKLLWLGGVDASTGTKPMHMIITHDLATDEFTDEKAGRIYVNKLLPTTVNTNRDAPIDLYDDYYELEANPTYSNTGLILGGLSLAA